MKKLIAPLILFVAALVGAAGGFALRLNGAASAPEGGAGTDEPSGAPPHASEDGEKDDGRKKSGAAHGKEASASTFMKFSRQFVTPVVAAGKPASMIILDVNLEVEAALGGTIYAEEPRLRDAMLRVLLKQASDGALERLFSDTSVLEATRAQMLVEARAIAGDGVLSVLIMDVGYQDL